MQNAINYSKNITRSKNYTWDKFDTNCPNNNAKPFHKKVILNIAEKLFFLTFNLIRVIIFIEVR